MNEQKLAIALPLADRAQAGRLLAQRLAAHGVVGKEVQIVALPRGGVVVAAALAAVWACPIQVLVVRKIGAPGQPELALAAMAEGQPPAWVWDEVVHAACAVEPTWWAQQLKHAEQVIAQRVHDYRGGQALHDLAQAHILLVDDGVATGATVRAARQALRQWQPSRLTLAVPVAPPALMARLMREFDHVCCLAQPEPFGAVGLHYRFFPPVTDAEVLHLLARSGANVTPAGSP